MAFLEVERLRVTDPLSEVTRKERRALLGVSAIGIGMVKTKLLPTRVSALGIDFSPADQDALLLMLSLITLYFLVAFLVYALSDFVAWRLGRVSVAYSSESQDYERARREVVTKLNLTPEQEEELRQLETSEGNMWRGIYIRHDAWARKVVPPVSIGRALFEFLLPAVISLYSMAVLLGARTPS